jgi:glycosyltransferase involved in cell wall biosynthesis
MRIGIDAKWFFAGNPSGREVVRNLVKYLFPKHPEHEFYVFLRRKDCYKEFPYCQANVHLEYIGGRFNLLSNLFFLPRRGNKRRLDVVVFQYFAPCFSKFRRVVYIHDAIFKTHPHFFSFWERCYFLPMKFLARRAHLIITVSQAERRQLEALGFSRRGKIEVNANGVSRAFRPVEAHDQDKLRQVVQRYSLPDRFLLYVGRIDIRKNIPGLLHAFAQLREMNVRLILAGSGNHEKQHIGEIIKKYGLIERVRLIGWIPDEDLPLLYALSYGFVYLSFVEGFGLPSLEALASGVPVVVSDIDVMHEVCGNAAVFVDPYDPASIAAGLSQIITDDVLRRELCIKGLAQAAKFDWEYSSEKLLDLIVNLK